MNQLFCELVMWVFAIKVKHMWLNSRLCKGLWQDLSGAAQHCQSLLCWGTQHYWRELGRALLISDLLGLGQRCAAEDRPLLLATTLAPEASPGSSVLLMLWHISCPCCLRCQTCQCTVKVSSSSRGLGPGDLCLQDVHPLLMRQLLSISGYPKTRDWPEAERSFLLSAPPLPHPEEMAMASCTRGCTP